MLIVLAALSAAARPLDPASFAPLDGGAGLLVATPSVLDPGLGTWTIDGTVHQGVLSEEGAWVFAFTALDVQAPVSVLRVSSPLPIAWLSRGALTLAADLSGDGAGHPDSVGVGVGTGLSAASHGGAGEIGPTGSPGATYGDPVLRIDHGSGGRTDARGGLGLQLGATGPLTVSGAIWARGLAPSAGPAGAGGGVLLRGGPGSACTGTVDVSGGVPATGPSGGGGRVVLIDVDAAGCTFAGVDPAGPAASVGVLVHSTDADGDRWPATHDPDDGDPDIYPGAPDGCDGFDDDADGLDGEHHLRAGSGRVWWSAVQGGQASSGRAPSVVGGRLGFPAGGAADVLLRQDLPPSVGGRVVDLQLARTAGQTYSAGVSDGSAWVGVALTGGQARLRTGADAGGTASTGAEFPLGPLADLPPLQLRLRVDAGTVSAVITNGAGASVSGQVDLDLDLSALDAVLVAADGAAAHLDALGLQVLDDADGDGVGDLCDPCPLDALDDADGDGVCDTEDVCPGHWDQADLDGDGVPDGCDLCPLDAPDDTDGDGVCDSDDVCPGHDDALDADGDGVPDGCDLCPLDAPDDTDGDGVCDSDDVCPGHDDAVDTDGDGVPDGCDPCPDDPSPPVGLQCPPEPPCPFGDADGDGVCDPYDQCPGHDDALDADGDGVPDGCDLCPDHPSPFQGDYDGDGLGDACDPCPADPDNTCEAAALCVGDEASGDADGDGFCADLDCDDDDATVYPGAPELCDGKDNACTGVGPDEDADLDGDGYSICQGDCADQDALRHPGAAELCNGVDDDCDGALGPDEADEDGDGSLACEDCDDQQPLARPGFPEVCGDGIDNDCDGEPDPVCPSTALPGGVPDDQGGCQSAPAPLWLGLPLLVLARLRRGGAR